MSKDEKLLSKILEKPPRNDITIAEIKAAAKLLGFEVCGGGKHPVHLYHKKSGKIIPIPLHGNIVGAVYIKQIAKIYEDYFKETIES